MSLWAIYGMIFVFATSQVLTAPQIITIKQEWLSVDVVNECRNHCVYPVHMEHNDCNSSNSKSDGGLLPHRRGETQVLPDMKQYHLIGSCPQEKHETVMSRAWNMCWKTRSGKHKPRKHKWIINSQDPGILRVYADMQPRQLALYSLGLFSTLAKLQSMKTVALHRIQTFQTQFVGHIRICVFPFINWQNEGY